MRILSISSIFLWRVWISMYSLKLEINHSDIQYAVSAKNIYVAICIVSRNIHSLYSSTYIKVGHNFSSIFWYVYFLEINISPYSYQPLASVLGEY